jgi:prephenate dehydrogenase
MLELDQYGELSATRGKIQVRYPHIIRLSQTSRMDGSLPVHTLLLVSNGYTDSARVAKKLPYMSGTLMYG